MTTRDSVTSEGSLFWRLAVKPTQFPANFCESVTRYFESDPERDPCPWRGHRWRMSFTENMINGVVTIDIEIVRARGASPQDQQQRQEGGEGPLVDGRRGIQHRTIRLHTPEKAAPVLSVALSDTALWDIPLRGKCIPLLLAFVPLERFEIDAAAILCRNLYQFEFVLSEQTWTDHVPSPSSRYRILDSLFHEVIPTSLPSPITADIWFEFHLEEAVQDGNPREAVVVVGAHEQVLSQRPYFARWIERERKRQEKERRSQLWEERRIHEQHRQQLLLQPRQVIPQLQRWRLIEDVGREHEQIEAHPTLEMRMEMTANGPWDQREDERCDEAIEQEWTSGHPCPESLSPQERCFDQSPWPFHTSSGSSRPSGAPKAVSAEGIAGFGPQQAEPATMLPSGPGDQPLPPIPFPALRVPVESMSQNTFHVLLQYIYTGQISLSEQQLAGVEMYRSDNAEGYQLSQDGMQSEQRFTEGGEATGSGGTGPETCRGEPHPKTPIILPPLAPLQPSPHSPKEHQHDVKDGRGSDRPTFTASLYAAWDRSYDDSPAMTSLPTLAYTSASALPLSSWIPCSFQNIHRVHGSGPNRPPPQPRAQGHGQQHQQHPGVLSHRKKGHPSTCSWENVLLAATECELADLQELAMKATQYRSQMMAIHAPTNSSTANYSDDDKDAQKELDETAQLALSEHVLRSFLDLYGSPLTKGQDAMSHRDLHRERESVYIKKYALGTQYEAGAQSSRSNAGSSSSSSSSVSVSVEPVDDDLGR